MQTPRTGTGQGKLRGPHLLSSLEGEQTPSPQEERFRAMRTAPQRKGAMADRMALGLGWFSVGLGLAQLFAPRAFSRAIGVQQSPMLMMGIGLREITSGVGILSRDKQAGWLWSRVAGDVMDLALLGMALRNRANRKERVAMATAAVAGVALLDVLSSRQKTLEETGRSTVLGGPVHVEKTLAVNRSPEECYRFWHDFENFPRFMAHVESVKVLDGKRSHWKAKGPAGMSVEWDAEIINDEPNRTIVWKSVANADVSNAGYVSFDPAPGGRGTMVKVEMQYRPPGGELGAAVAKLFGEEPEQQLKEDLRRFKQMLETGEIPTIDGQPSGRRGPVTRLIFRKGKPG